MQSSDGKRDALVCAARAGDAEAFTRLIQAHTASALALATWRVKDRHSAEDIVQEACIEAFCCLPQLREPAAFTSWFRRILLKQIDRVLRTNEAPTTSLDETCEAAADTDMTMELEREERHALAHAALAQLSPAIRDVAELFYLSELSYQQIADTLTVPVTTVKKRLHDARRQLREHAMRLERQPLTHAAGVTASLHTRLRFFIALQRGELAHIRNALDAYPELAHAREEWNETLASIYHLGMPARYTPLHRAAVMGAVDIARCLIDHQADLNARASQNLTPLHVATLNGRSALVELLLDAGAHPDLTTDIGMAPLHWAAIRGDEAIMALLLRAGATPDCKDCSGRTAREWSALSAIRSHPIP